ncbi:hypothetical protein CLOP_g12210 [Closterium sp. NIES-67]|nr:hypothetical protein CLOP_g12210 [Closterium sp. NIES-67]
MQRGLPLLLLLLALVAPLPRVPPSQASAPPRTCGAAGQEGATEGREAEEPGARAGAAPVCDAREGQGEAGDVGSGGGGEGRAQEYLGVLDEAERQLDAGEWAQAAELFSRVAHVGEGGGTVWAAAGSAGAWGAQEMAVRERMLQGRGWAHTLLQSHALAERDLDEGVARFPGNSRMWERRGSLHFDMGKMHEAYEDFSHVLALRPNDIDALRWRGLAAHRLRRHPTAIADLSRVLQAEPMDAFLLKTMALSYTCMGQYRESLPLWQQAVQRHGDMAEMWEEKGSVHRILGEALPAMHCLLTALHIRSSVAVYRNIVALRRGLGDYQGAIAYAREGVRAQGGDLELLYAEACALHALGDLPQALAKYTHLFAQRPSSDKEASFLIAAFYQRELLAYTVARLDLPFAAFHVDAHMPVDLKNAWMRREHPKTIPSYQRINATVDQWEHAMWPLTPGGAMSDAALALIAAADVIGERAHCHVDGMLRNKMQLRMAGLAALDVMQQVRRTWEAVAKAQEQEEEEEEEEGDGGIGGWRDVFQIIARWRQIANPTDATFWKDLLLSPQRVAVRSTTPIKVYDLETVKYYPVHDRAVALTRATLLEHEEAFDANYTRFSLPRSTYGNKIEAASDLAALHAAVGRDFSALTFTHSALHPGRLIPGTEFQGKKTNHSYDFYTETSLDAGKWSKYDEEMTAAWES